MVPSTYSPDIMGHFKLSLISSSPVDVEEMNENKSIVCAGKWEVSGANKENENTLTSKI